MTAVAVVVAENEDKDDTMSVESNNYSIYHVDAGLEFNSNFWQRAFTCIGATQETGANPPFTCIPGLTPAQTIICQRQYG